MRHQNILFHDVLKYLPLYCLDRFVEKYGADDLSRKLDTKCHLIALLYGQLSGATSLREIVTGMASHQTRLYHVGAVPVRRSTLSDANAQRPWQVFGDVFTALLKQAHRGLRRATADAVRLIDSTTIPLSSLSADWATFSTEVFGVKAHIVYDPQADRPIYFAVTSSKVNDITAAKAMPIEPGATYVYDLGYYDYGWWAALDDAGCRFVTRLKKNTPLTVVHENRVPKNGNILSDRIGHLPQRLARSRRNPLQVPVRELRVILEAARNCGSSPTILILRPTRSPISTSSAGRLNCFFDGSSRPCASRISSAHPKTPCAFRSWLLSSPSCCCVWRKPLKKPYAAPSTSSVWCGRTSCKDAVSINCSNRHRRSRSIQISSVLDYTVHEPDSPGSSPGMTPPLWHTAL